MVLDSPDMATISRIQRTVLENDEIASEQRRGRGGGGVGAGGLADVRSRRSEWSDRLKSMEKGNRKSNNQQFRARCAAYL